MKSKRVYFSTIVFFIALAFVFFVLDIFLGSVSIPFNETISILLGNVPSKESWGIIILDSRFPKALAATLCGAALSVSGLQMQTLFKNPLAGPYILGISSGAGLGVAIFVMGLSIIGVSFSESNFLFNYGIIIFSILGSIVVLSILLAVINRLKDIMSVLILGIMIGSVITAMIGIIQFLSTNSQLKSFIMWTMGDLSSLTNAQASVLLITISIGIIISFLITKQLNAYLLGEEYAKSLGINIKTTRFIIIINTAILAGGITAFCGPIGFIGIIIPHIARLILKSADHRKLTIFCILLGINVMLFADIISQLPGTSTSLPINSITSLIGIPFIIWMVVKNRTIKSIN